MITHHTSYCCRAWKRLRLYFLNTSMFSLLDSIQPSCSMVNPKVLLGQTMGTPLCSPLMCMLDTTSSPWTHPSRPLLPLEGHAQARSCGSACHAGQHINDVATVLKAPHDAGPHVHPGKSVFCFDMREYLGHVDTPADIEPQAATVAALAALSAPTSVAAL